MFAAICTNRCDAPSGRKVVRTWLAKIAARRMLKTSTAVADRILMILSVQITADECLPAQRSLRSKRLAVGWTAGAMRRYLELERRIKFGVCCALRF